MVSTRSHGHPSRADYTSHPLDEYLENQNVTVLSPKESRGIDVVNMNSQSENQQLPCGNLAVG